jgi:hypothetical protein
MSVRTDGGCKEAFKGGEVEYPLTFPLSSQAKAISLARRIPSATRKSPKPSREALVVALAERDRELAEARRREVARKPALRVSGARRIDLSNNLNRSTKRLRSSFAGRSSRENSPRRK